jgi:hypothetical protein
LDAPVPGVFDLVGVRGPGTHGPGSVSSPRPI